MRRTGITARSAILLAAISAALALFGWSVAAAGEGPDPRVELDAASTAPRQVEELTAKGVVRDYKQAWSRLADAMERGEPGLLEGSFVGASRTEFAGAVAAQNASGVQVHYRNQQHSLKAVFYAPEGDVLQLHDTMECDLQITDGSDVVHQEHATLHYVVLMTPGADRWVVRQMQAVAGF